MNWTAQDIAQLKKKKIRIEQVEEQIDTFNRGFPHLEITDAATLGNGITRLSENEIVQNIRKYNYESRKLKIVKFVPASGAASRMFKGLFELMKSKPGSEEFKQLMSDKSFASPANFFKNIRKFAFYYDLGKTDILKDKNIEQLVKDNQLHDILHALLDESGLNYGNKPKGLLKFHKYENGMGTPCREHLVEGTLYASGTSEIYIHFTVSPEHMNDFKEHVELLKKHFEAHFAVNYFVSFSIQKPQTDTIAVDLNNQPFRDKDGSLVFRPGGHGALIENMNELNADLIFIKNIDNVVPDRLKEETTKYKKALAGVLISYKEKIINYLQKIENQEINNNLFVQIEQFLKKELCFIPGDSYRFLSFEDKLAYLFNKLNRPLRVCGMVKNEGEPGGGPFWAKNKDGSVSLQIVESSQIDFNKPENKKIVQEATHFNPVDIVCCVKDYKGNKFDLSKYIDKNTGFISEKSKNGKALKALELPGLWNGAMADWNTVFVEVPIATFNPVKVVNDLLRPEHQ
ncbi:MAG: DUF4301 family protein [Bacteroidales bacterium]|nr:DUF4301 family protein [Bacteroidales bacterium]